MTSDLRPILEDLYALDPALREHEAELIPLLTNLLAHKPAAHPDPAFVKRLRGLLQARTEQPATQSWQERLASLFAVSRLATGLGGAVAGVLVGVALLPLLRPGALPESATVNEAGSPLFSYSVSQSAPAAFGDLSTGRVSIADDAPLGLGGGVEGGGMDGVDMMLRGDVPVDRPTGDFPPRILTEYVYAFEGELPDLTDETVDVYKRRKGIAGADAATLLRLGNIGPIDLDTFEGGTVDSISFVQDRPYGYTYSVAFREGTIAIYQNWERWPQPQIDCQTEECFRRARLQPSDLPPDDVVLDAARRFVSTHRIDVSRYGEPEIDKGWMRTYARMSAAERENFFIGETIRVVYPFLLEGQPVFDESGMKHGITIGVHVRERRVQEAWGITDRTYVASAYPAVTDGAAILEHLEESGAGQPTLLPADRERQTIVVTLGTPERGYVTLFRSDGRQADELLIPALVFPVTNVPEGASFHRTSVTVPLAADLFEQQRSRDEPIGIPPMPRPMPVR